MLSANYLRVHVPTNTENTSNLFFHLKQCCQLSDFVAGSGDFFCQKRLVTNRATSPGFIGDFEKQCNCTLPMYESVYPSSASSLS